LATLCVVHVGRRGFTTNVRKHYGAWMRFYRSILLISVGTCWHGWYETVARSEKSRQLVAVPLSWTVQRTALLVLQLVTDRSPNTTNRFTDHTRTLLVNGHGNGARGHCVRNCWQNARPKWKLIIYSRVKGRWPGSAWRELISESGERSRNRSTAAQRCRSKIAYEPGAAIKSAISRSIFVRRAACYYNNCCYVFACCSTRLRAADENAMLKLTLSSSLIHYHCHLPSPSRKAAPYSILRSINSSNWKDRPKMSCMHGLLNISFFTCNVK